jgi:ribosomal protein S18 acetylase RimI-like enzyme
MAAFYAESGYPLPEAPATRAFTTLLADARLGGAWLAEINGEPVGHTVLTVSFSMEYGGLRGFVDDLYVRPEARRRGVGAALLRALHEDCAARGVRAVHVEVDSEDTVARRLYARAGYTDSGHLLLTRRLAAPVHAT